MSLLAESLVEEWLNRKGFFTIRGIKHGVGELDLLGIHRESNGSVTGWHVEVQASFRPIGYITKSKPLGYLKHRTPKKVEMCVQDYVRLKFSGQDKERVRESLWSGMKWEFHLVYAEARHAEELQVFEGAGVKCHRFTELLDELSHRSDHTYSGSAGGDLAEIVAYYKSQQH